MTYIEEYISYWRELKVNNAPYVHDEDRKMIFEDQRFKLLKYGSRQSNLLEAPGKTQLHLQLLPAPHTGDLRKARIFLVSLNPSVAETNYDDEADETFRRKLIAQIHQRFEGQEYPLLTLDPTLAHTGGYAYWNKYVKFGGLMDEIAKSHFKDAIDPKTEARRWLAQNVATIEVMPYKSKSYDARCDNVHSFQVAKAFLDGYLKPKALKGELLVIVTRKLKQLGLKYEERTDDLVLYHPTKGNEALRSHLTPDKTDGGKAILRWCGNLLTKQA